MEYYFAQVFWKFSLPASQVHFARSQISHCYLAILQSSYAQLSSPHCKACIPKLATAHQQGQLSGPLHPVDCLNEVQPAHKFENFWAVQCQYSSALPKTQTAPHFFFFHRLPRLSPSPPSFPSLSPPLSLSFPDWMALSNLRLGSLQTWQCGLDN